MLIKIATEKFNRLKYNFPLRTPCLQRLPSHIRIIAVHYPTSVQLLAKDFTIRALLQPNRRDIDMCFSSEASFAGSIIISTIGIATITKVRTPSQLVFASIPLFFGIQQLAEGILWQTLPTIEYESIQKLSTYVFLVMAQVIWPVMIPLSVLLMEQNDRRRKMLRIFLALGLALSAYYACCLLLLTVTPQIMGYHIQYVNNFPKSISLLAFAVYLVATITPLFVSSIKRTHLLGALMALSCLITAIFFTQYLTSVWCFFAALISGVIYWILRDAKIAAALPKAATLNPNNHRHPR